MSKKSDYSKKLLTKIWIFRGIDAIILVAPLAVYFIMALVNEETVLYQKMALVGSAMVALILVIINILAKTHLRSAIWIMIIGLFIAVDDLMPLIYSIAAATILDEFAITPLIRMWHTKYLASRTMDDREAM